MNIFGAIRGLGATMRGYRGEAGWRGVVLWLGVLLALVVVDSGPAGSATISPEYQTPTNFVPLSKCITGTGDVVVGAKNGAQDCSKVEVDKSYKVLGFISAKVTNQHPVSLNNLEVNASGSPGANPSIGSVDECLFNIATSFKASSPSSS